ncbi:TERF1-interacting nuclear factor 2 isoform X2 [Carassius gibelio]|uniref:TERF1-interacting nuclear factor 2 isoform X2 n=1 Tax=Carassius gibelio TaxID=101364 RepID=UPI002277BF85|nr:TERF1-interacting nuclear factor 2 isoform X2 [Carassius gibelio]
MKTATNTMNEDAPLPLSALQLIAPSLRLMSAAMWKVMLQRDTVHYGKLEETITTLCETVPGLLYYRHQARLTIGLRALMILEELRQSDPPDAQRVLQELHKLLESSFPIGKMKDQKVEEAKRNFQTLVYSLLKNAAARKQFFTEEFHLHYGGNYVANLEKLLLEFLIRLDKLLPVPDLAQTVSWLSSAPAVLEECARSASQPQLLRTLLQHERCLGHLGSECCRPSNRNPLPYATGSQILPRQHPEPLTEQRRKPSHRSHQLLGPFPMTLSQKK